MKKFLLLACTLFLAMGLSAQTPQSYVENAGCDLGLKMIRVEGGTFQMGSNEGAEDEKPVHSVTLSSYYIAECEITQAQWQKIMRNNPSGFRGDDRPVDQVSWEAALIFCRELSMMTGKKYVLPTEAQWEYAARGGKHSLGNVFSGSFAVDKVAWYESNSGNGTHSVKQKQANELGLYDMSGNVWEWCEDWYDSYSSSSQTNPTGPTSGSDRVLRGGSWDDDARNCRVSSRHNFVPSCRYCLVGFRVVCLLESTPQSPSQKLYKKSDKIGDVITINGVKGVVFEVTDGGEHGKVISVNQAPNKMSWSAAITWCSNLGSGWRLPTEEELLLIHMNIASLNPILAAIGDEIPDGWHWSLSEYDSDEAWLVYMFSGLTGASPKNNLDYVRAVSAF